MFFGNNGKIKNSTLRSVDYTFGGDMNGSYRSAYLAPEEDGNALLKIEIQTDHWSPKTRSFYQVPAEELEKVKTMILEYDLYRGSKRPRQKYELLDAGSGDLCFTFKDAPSFRLHTELDLTEKQDEGFTAVRDLLFRLGEERTPIRTETEEQTTGGNP